MTQAQVTAAGLVRVTVSSGSRRVDLALPGAVPVAELLPELARSVGLLDPASVHGGYRVVTADGHELAGDAGLLVQGVVDGGLLAVSAAADDPPPRVHDDVAEAMADVVEHRLRPWRAEDGRRTALWVAGLLLVLGAVAPLARRDSVVLAAVVAGVAAALAVGAIGLSRARRRPVVAVAVAWAACLYAAVAGALLVDAPSPASPAAAAGGAAVVVGLVCLVGIGPGRVLVLPPVVAGAVHLVAGAGAPALGVAPEVPLTVAVVVVVLLGGAAPWLALGATSTSVDHLEVVGTADPHPVDLAGVEADARLAHEILVAVSAGVGLVLVTGAPVAVGLGAPGALLATLCCAAVLLRTRRHRTYAGVLVGVVAGVLGLLAVAGTALWVHPEWRPGVELVLTGAGVGLLAVALGPAGAGVRRGRWAELAESASLVALLPLLLVAVGVVSAIRG